MAVHQLPVEAGVFARYLKGLTALLDRSSGWYGIFWQRDPGGMRACLDGFEIPPWDVVEALIHDLGARRGAAVAEQEYVRARHLHAASAAAHDRRPGGREALGERLELMLREEVYATGRAEELLRGLAGEPEGTPAAEQLANELQWTRDDYARATSRVAELRSRLGALDASTRGRRGAPGVAEGGHGPGPAGRGTPEGYVPAQAGPVDGSYGADAGWPAGGDVSAAPDAGYGPGPGSPEGYVPAQAGPVDDSYEPDPGFRPAAESHEGYVPAQAGPASGWYQPEAGPDVRDTPASDRTYEAYERPGEPVVPDGWFRPDSEAAPGPDAPSLPAEPPPTPPAPTQSPAPVKKRRPRGARFAGVEDDGEEIAAVPALPVAGDVPRGARYGGAAPEEQAPAAPAPPPGAGRAARETVAELRRLRAEGRSGEAHAVLCEAAARPAPWLPLLAAELHRVGLAADWATLLWETASQPALRLAAAAGALAAAGRTEDSRQLLRQGVTRPADDIADAVLTLEDESRAPEARALLAAFVQIHAAEDTAHIADRDPRRLVPWLLDAARAISADHERDLVHALRVAGHLGT
ncbi:hypothetical protein [Streptomyces sp. NPDC001820]|uniref:hypothetical protein n=1 Tax=Streptomyces sp. NPDC001820 TaxID=3364613 RepID=UPI0036B8EB59